MLPHSDWLIALFTFFPFRCCPSPELTNLLATPHCCFTLNCFYISVLKLSDVRKNSYKLFTFSFTLGSSFSAYFVSYNTLLFFLLEGVSNVLTPTILSTKVVDATRCRTSFRTKLKLWSCGNFFSFQDVAFYFFRPICHFNH